METHDRDMPTGRHAPPPGPLLHVVDTIVACELGEDAALLNDAAAVLSARRELDGLLVQLTAQPFSASAYTGLRAYLSGPADRALAAYQRVCASTTARPGP
jgi:hypothetical protein